MKVVRLIGQALGLSEEVKVKFKKYTFFINSSKIEAETVSLTYPQKFDGEVEGIFEYQVETVKNVDDKSYPEIYVLQE